MGHLQEAPYLVQFSDSSTQQCSYEINGQQIPWMFERLKSTIFINVEEDYLKNMVQNQFSYQDDTVPFLFVF